MPLPFSRSPSVFESARSAVGQAAGFAAIPSRAFAVLSGIESLVDRINAAVDRVDALLDRAEGMLDGAEEAVRRVGAVTVTAEEAVERAAVVSAEAEAVVGGVARISAAAGTVIVDVERVAAAAGELVGEAGEITGRAAATMARAELVATTADELLTAYESTLRKGAPMLNRFVEQLSPEEVTAAIRLVDELPKLTGHLTSNILPILATLDRVGPDIHDLLEVTRDLKLAVAGIPGLRMLRRRGEDRLAED